MKKKNNNKIVTRLKADSLSEKKKPFIQPEVKVYSKLEDITLFTSVANVSGGVFF